jgi:hypothetical protein
VVDFSVVLPLLTFISAALKIARSAQASLHRRRSAESWLRDDEEHIVLFTIVNGETQSVAMEFRRIERVRSESRH